MARHATPAATHPPARNPFRTAALALLGVAVLLSAWLVYLSLQTGPIPGCEGNNCGVVLGSKWAKIFGVPVGFFGAATYSVLALLGLRPFAPGAAQRGPRIAAAAITCLIPLAGLWFAAVQIFILKAFCPWCTATHITATLAAVLMILAWRRDDAPPAPTSGGGRHPRPSARPASRPPVWGAAALAASVAFAGFLGAQVLSPEPPKPKILRASMSTSATPTPVPAPAPAPAATAPAPATPAGTNALSAATAPASPTAGAAMATTNPAAPTTPGPRQVVLHDGRFTINPLDVPVYGSPTAEHLVVMISDYTCRHCRHAIQTLREVREHFGPRLALLMIPAQHGGDSLDIQRLMLAAWRVDPSVWSEVGGDVYYERIGALGAAIRPVLEQRLGADRLRASLDASAAWSQQLLDLGRDLQATNRLKTGSGSIPQFIIGKEIIVGAPSDAAEFYELFEQHLGLVRERFPVLQLVQTEFDLGKVFAGTSPHLRVPLVNAGQAPLELSRAALPQGGRLIRGLTNALPPGQTSSVDIAISVPREPGPFDQNISLFGNSRPPSSQFRIKGTVWKPVRIEPAVLDFGRLDPDNLGTQAVMRIEFDEEAMLESVRSQNPGFSATLREITPGRKYELQVATTPEIGNGNQQATLLTSLRKPAPPGWPENLAFGARAIVERAVTVLPQRLVIPPGPLATDRHQSVLVRCTGNDCADFKVTSTVLEGGPAFILPEVGPAGGTNQFLVKVTLPAGWSAPLPPADTKLVIRTTHPRYPRLEVPILPQGQPQ